MSAVVEAARQKEASRISSWQDPIESGKADTALEEFEAQCDEYTRVVVVVNPDPLVFRLYFVQDYLSHFLTLNVHFFLVCFH